jgi:hypothetical protein
VQDALLAWPRLLGASAPAGRHETSPLDLLHWQAALARSMLSDPVWHTAWTLDVQSRWARLLQTMKSGARDRRADGLPTPEPLS